MTPTKKPDAEKRNAEREAALTFVRMAKEKGLDLTGPDGLLKQFTKSVLETALEHMPRPVRPDTVLPEGAHKESGKLPNPPGLYQ